MYSDEGGNADKIVGTVILRINLVIIWRRQCSKGNDEMTSKQINEAYDFILRHEPRDCANKCLLGQYSKKRSCSRQLGCYTILCTSKEIDICPFLWTLQTGCFSIFWLQTSSMQPQRVYLWWARLERAKLCMPIQ